VVLKYEGKNALIEDLNTEFKGSCPVRKFEIGQLLEEERLDLANGKMLNLLTEPRICFQRMLICLGYVEDV